MIYSSVIGTSTTLDSGGNSVGTLSTSFDGGGAGGAVVVVVVVVVTGGDVA